MPESDPISSYLATLAPASRRVLGSDLRALSGLAGGEQLWTLGVDQGVELRAAVASRWAPATANRVLAAWRGVIRAAWRSGALSWDAQARLLAAIAPVRGGRVTRGRSLTFDQLRRMLEHAPGQEERAAIALLAGAGLRRSEAAALTWDRLTRHDQDHYVRVLGKGNRERRLRIPAWAASELNRWRSRCPAGRAEVFRWRDGSQLWAVVAQASARAGLGHVAPHDLRRTFYALCRRSGLDIRDIQRAMGHSSITTTARYDRRSDDEALELLARLDNLEGGKATDA